VNTTSTGFRAFSPLRWCWMLSSRPLRPLRVRSSPLISRRYSDQRFRRTAALFWSSTWPDKSFHRQLRESRKIEDIILPFVTTATKALKKEEELADGSWKWELNNQISLFLELLSDSLVSVGPIPAELTSRLEGYRTRLKADPPPPERDKAESIKDADRMSVRSGQAGHAGGTGAGAAGPEGLKGKGTEGVAKLWGLSDEAFQSKLRELHGVCTEQAALEDLKVSTLVRSNARICPPCVLAPR
jgi:hypothetical protein